MATFLTLATLTSLLSFGAHGADNAQAGKVVEPTDLRPPGNELFAVLEKATIRKKRDCSVSSSVEPTNVMLETTHAKGAQTIKLSFDLMASDYARMACNRTGGGRPSDAATWPPKQSPKDERHRPVLPAGGCLTLTAWNAGNTTSVAFEIVNATEKDSGSYQCNAVNTCGSTTLFFFLNIPECRCSTDSKTFSSKSPTVSDGSKPYTFPHVTDLKLPAITTVPSVPLTTTPRPDVLPGIPNVPGVLLPKSPHPIVPDQPFPTFPQVPDIKQPGLPNVPDLPLPTFPQVPDIKLPGLPNVPDLPLPNVHDVPLPTFPQILDIKLPGLPNVPDVPLPNVHDVPLPTFPQVPDIKLPGIPEALDSTPHMCGCDDFTRLKMKQVQAAVNHLQAVLDAYNS